MPDLEIVYHRPHLEQYQLDALFHDKRYGFIEGTTKAGKTVGSMAWLLEQAMLGKHKNYGWGAPVYQQAKIAFSRFKDYIPPEHRTPHETDLTLTLPNGHVMWFKSLEKPDNAFGDDFGAWVLDEASRMRQEAYFAARSTVTATNGKLRVIGNVKGRKNFFYNFCRRAEAGEPDMHYARITCYDAVKAGIIPQSEVDDAKRNLPESVFNELYLAIPSDDGGNPFGLGHIERCLGELSTSPAVCYGVDLAKSVDFTVIIGLDHAGRVCEFERFQKPWQETKARIRETCGSVMTIVDSTGLGDPILEDLQRPEKGIPSGHFEGFKFTQSSKQQLMEGLAVGIQQKLITLPDGPIRIELDSFEYEYTRSGVRYTCAEGLHDDCVCALALAWSIFRGKASKRAASVWNGGGTSQGPTPSWAR